jgi:hypothetical protein
MLQRQPADAGITAAVVDRLIHGRKLRSRQTRLREKGYLTLPEAAAAWGISNSEVAAAVAKALS